MPLGLWLFFAFIDMVKAVGGWLLEHPVLLGLVLAWWVSAAINSVSDAVGELKDTVEELKTTVDEMRDTIDSKDLDDEM